MVEGEVGGEERHTKRQVRVLRMAGMVLLQCGGDV